ncbi:MAG: PAS domain S-box protein [Burkholderiaceae bacterium]
MTSLDAMNPVVPVVAGPPRARPAPGVKMDEAGFLRMIRQDNAEKAYILENSHSAVLVFGVDGNLQWGNRGFDRLSGYASQELIGRRFSSLMERLPENRTARQMLRRAWPAARPSLASRYCCAIATVGSTGWRSTCTRCSRTAN